MPKHNFIGTFTPATAAWALKMQRPGWVETAPGADLVFSYGSPNDTPLVGDWDGDGVETQGVWHDGVWSLADVLGGPATNSFAYGDPAGGVPVVGDWDGDGTTTPGVFQAGTFHLRNANSAGVADVVVMFGAAGDTPLAGDWDGDGVATVGVYRPSDTRFYLTNENSSNPSPDITLQYGDVGDIPVVGDWNQDGVWTVGVRDGTTFLLTDDLTSGLAQIGVDYGASGDVPLAGAWNAGASSGHSTVPRALTDFFLLGAWDQPSTSFQKWRDRGINTVIEVSEDIDPWTAGANQTGLMMIRRARPDPPTGPADNPDRNEPRLIAWLLGDETDFAGEDGVDAMRSLRADWAQIDASRPAVINFTAPWSPTCSTRMTPSATGRATSTAASLAIRAICRSRTGCWRISIPRAGQCRSIRSGRSATA